MLQILSSLSIWLRIRISRAVQNSKKGCTWCTFYILLLLSCYQKNASAPFIVLRFPNHTIGDCPVYLQPQHVHGTPCRALYFLKGSGFKLAFALYIQYSLYLLVVWKIGITQSIPNWKTFDFFDTKFDHSSYSQICVKYNFFRRGLVY